MIQSPLNIDEYHSAKGSCQSCSVVLERIKTPSSSTHINEQPKEAQYFAKETEMTELLSLTDVADTSYENSGNVKENRTWKEKETEPVTEPSERIKNEPIDEPCKPCRVPLERIQTVCNSSNVNEQPKEMQYFAQNAEIADLPSLTNIASISHEKSSLEEKRVRREEKKVVPKRPERVKNKHVDIFNENPIRHSERMAVRKNYNEEFNAPVLSLQSSRCSEEEEMEYNDNSFCVICEGYDDPMMDANQLDPKSEWIGCDCDRWYHKSCIGIPVVAETFSCVQVKQKCLEHIK